MRYSRNSIAYSKLASYLVKARKEKGLSMEQLAEKLGVHFSIVGKIEKCRRKLDTLEFIVYCQALDINPAELIQELEQFLETHESDLPQFNSNSKT